MDSPIVIKFRWTADELSKAQRYHFRQACRPVLRFALHFIFALMILAGYGWISSGKSWPIGIGFIAAGIYWFALRPFDQRWALRRQFAKPFGCFWSADECVGRQSDVAKQRLFFVWLFKTPDWVAQFPECRRLLLHYRTVALTANLCILGLLYILTR